jgi:hypothetical protein
VLRASGNTIEAIVSLSYSFATSYTDESVAPDTAYLYYVLAKNSAGWGSISSSVSTRTLPAPVVAPEPEILAQTLMCVTATNNDPYGYLRIEGQPHVGHTLRVITSYFSDDDGLGTLSYSWHRETGTNTFAPISGATAKSYRITSDDRNRELRVTVGYEDAGGCDETFSHTLDVVAQPDIRKLSRSYAHLNWRVTPIVNNRHDFDAVGSGRWRTAGVTQKYADGDWDNEEDWIPRIKVKGYVRGKSTINPHNALVRLGSERTLFSNADGTNDGNTSIGSGPGYAFSIANSTGVGPSTVNDRGVHGYVLKSIELYMNVGNEHTTPKVSIWSAQPDDARTYVYPYKKRVELTSPARRSGWNWYTFTMPATDGYWFSASGAMVVIQSSVVSGETRSLRVAYTGTQVVSESFSSPSSLCHSDPSVTLTDTYKYVSFRWKTHPCEDRSTLPVAGWESNAAGLTHFEIYRRVDGGTYTHLANVTAAGAGGVNGIRDLTVQTGHTYQYAVKAINENLSRDSAATRSPSIRVPADLVWRQYPISD